MGQRSQRRLDALCRRPPASQAATNALLFPHVHKKGDGGIISCTPLQPARAAEISDESVRLPTGAARRPRRAPSRAALPAPAGEPGVAHLHLARGRHAGATPRQRPAGTGVRGGRSHRDPVQELRGMVHRGFRDHDGRPGQRADLSHGLGRDHPLRARAQRGARDLSRQARRHGASRRGDRAAAAAHRAALPHGAGRRALERLAGAPRTAGRQRAPPARGHLHAGLHLGQYRGAQGRGDQPPQHGGLGAEHARQRAGASRRPPAVVPAARAHRRARGGGAAVARARRRGLLRRVAGHLRRGPAPRPAHGVHVGAAAVDALPVADPAPHARCAAAAPARDTAGRTGGGMAHPQGHGPRFARACSAPAPRRFRRPCWPGSRASASRSAKAGA